jgi:dihydrolipoamide dehydrogenase
MFDVIIIGSGPAGYVAAIRAAQLGLKVACIEKSSFLGGTCLNVGCIPSKALLHSTEFLLHSKRMENRGIYCSPKFDYSKLQTHKNGVVEGFRKGIESLFLKHKIVKIQGHARLTSSTSVDVEGKNFEAKQFILATGSSPQSLPFLPFDEKRVFSSTGLLSISNVPQSILVVGGGIIGVEMGSIFSRLGSDVQIVEALDRICPTFDRHISTALQKSLEVQGIKFHLSTKIDSAVVGSNVQLNTSKGTFTADTVLVAVGRKPYLEGLGVEELGIIKDSKGFIEVDRNFRTSIPSIYAIGDLISGPMLAHKAEEEAIALAEYIAGKKSHVNYITIPSVAYTYPEVAAVGFTEQELKEKSIPYKVGQFPFKVNSRAKAIGHEEGFVKTLSHEKTGKILGIHIMGAHASEMITEATLAISNGLTAEELGHLCHPHPTLSEAIKESALMAHESAIHLS